MSFREPISGGRQGELIPVDKVAWIDHGVADEEVDSTELVCRWLDGCNLIFAISCYKEPEFLSQAVSLAVFRSTDMACRPLDYFLEVGDKSGPSMI